MPFKAALFDMDGVIVNTEPLHKKAYFEMFDNFQLKVPQSLYATFTGKSTWSVCQKLVALFELTCSPQELVDKKRECFGYLFDHDTEFNLLPGVEALLENYASHGVKMVLASSASMLTINRVFERFHLAPYFMDKLSGADLTASKPHPEIFELAAKRAGEPKANCIVIEDSTNGIQAAHAAKIRCVAYKSPHSKDQDYELAQKVISDFAEIHMETAFYNTLGS